MAIVTEQAALPSFTASDIITRAYRILGDLAPGESMTAAQETVGLEALNALLDSFSIEKLMIYQIRQESLTWPSSTASRTIGPSGDFATHRPDRIEVGTHVTDSNGVDYPVRIVTRETYDAVWDKSVTSSYPEMLFYDRSVSEGTIHLYPVPDQSLTLKLNTWQPLTVFDTLTEALVLPAGYRRMLCYNLAVELEAETGLPVPPSAVAIARSSRAAVKRNNHIQMYSATEPAYLTPGGSRFNINRGY